MADQIAWYAAHADNVALRYEAITDVKTLGEFVNKKRAEVMRPQGAER